VTAIFYELLLGVAPGGRWEPLSRERADLPVGIDAVIEKGLSSRPRSRYQNAQEYQRALYELRNAPAPTPGPAPKPVVPPAPPAPSPFAGNKKRWIIIGAAVLFGLGLIGALVERYNTEQSNFPQPQPQPPPVPPVPPVSPSYANLQSTWYDELTGAGIALLHVVIQQRGDSISGPILDANGVQWGTFSGRVNGNAFEYNYYSSFGNGWGRGTLAPDGNHLQVLVNGVERHTFHRNHLPPY
jgi:hypothetical protein